MTFQVGRNGRWVWLAILLLGGSASPALAAPPLPPTDPLGVPTLTVGDAREVFEGLRTIIYALVVLLVLSMGVNVYLAWVVKGFQDTVAKMIQGMGSVQQSQAALREVAQYWLERQADRLAREGDEDLYAPSRHAVPRGDDPSSRGIEAEP